MNLKLLIVFFVTILTLRLGATSTNNTSENPSDPSSVSKESTISSPSSANSTSTGSASQSTVSQSTTSQSTTPQLNTTESSTTSPSVSTKPTGPTSTNSSEKNTESSTTTTTTTPTPSFADNVDNSTQNLLGINCMVNGVYDLLYIAPDFVFNIGLCGDKVQKEAAPILDEIDKLQLYGSKVKEVNDDICENSNFDIDKDANKVPSSKCVKNIKTSMNKFNKSVGATLKKVNAYFKKTTNMCASMALLKFKLNLNNFNAVVYECAQITSD